MNFIVKCFKWINANKKSIVGTVGALLTSVATAYATYGGYFDFLPKLMVGEFDFMALIVGVVCFALVELGVTGKGFETIKAFGDRITVRKEQKAQEKINAEARAEIKAEEKLASLNQEKQEKAKAKAEAEALAKQAKEQAEKEHREKVEAVKLAMKAEAETKNQSLAQ